MPVITFEGSTLSREQKQELVERFTRAASEVTKIPEQAFVVFVHENDPDNIGVGGVLLSTKRKNS
ncbi:4-oxalocrotonate tautomerase DmpI [Desulfotomaculum copahuensis]|uniref:4-oxalocrotonate tautomerase n=1 Tax=Desulfotomaculum copahuensis TaxID=1838280 RepID=A0A1B7LJ76_9FIRM|nr:4-oxalocrotonate tautomerase DmpI [Desulfotomaculum copahuensis]OAT86522.1 4-oxalocrotonate tautomerase [Desulfotomaculum copahuensis]